MEKKIERKREKEDRDTEREKKSRRHRKNKRVTGEREIAKRDNEEREKRQSECQTARDRKIKYKGTQVFPLFRILFCSFLFAQFTTANKMQCRLVGRGQMTQRLTACALHIIPINKIDLLYITC